METPPLGTLLTTKTYTQQAQPGPEHPWLDCTTCGPQRVQTYTLNVRTIQARWGPRDQPAGFTGTCPTCGAAGRVRLVTDTFKTSLLHPKERHACSANCEAATGFNCECQCQGRNHGRAS